MTDSKINKLLQALPNDVKQQFAKSLNKDTAPYRLLKYLTTDGKEIERTDKILKSVIKAKRKDANKALGNVAFELYKLLQEWLIAKELEADELTQNKLLANAFKRYKLTDTYIKTLEKRTELIEAQTHRDMWHHLEGMRLAHARYFHSTNNFSDDVMLDYFTKSTQHLGDFYLLTRLIYLAEQHTRNFNFNEKKQWTDKQNILESDTKNPIARLYILIFKLMKSPDNEMYKNSFLPLLEKHIDEIQPENRATLATFHINYTSLQRMEGNTAFLAEQYKAYRNALDNGYLEYESPLHIDHFFNAVTVAAVSGEFDWCKQLIKDAPKRLEGEKEKVKNYCRLALALFHFYKKDIDASQKLLDETTFEDVNYRLRVRSLKAQCGYEQFLNDKGATPLLDDLEAYRGFMQRASHELPKDTYDANINFIFLLKKMAGKLPDERHNILTKALRNKQKPLIAKAWLKTLLKK